MHRPPQLPARRRAEVDRGRIGAAAEAAAARHLSACGLEILERNFRRRLGEIDLVAREGAVLVIVEVRTRSSSAYGGAAASVNAAKQRRIVRTAQQLLQSRPELAALPARFDVIVVHAAESPRPRIEWIRHAFQA